MSHRRAPFFPGCPPDPDRSAGKNRNSPLPGCGASVVDPNKCIGCGVCTTKCEFDAIHLHRDLPECSTMVRSEDKFKAILPYMVKREVKIRFGKKDK